MRGSWFERVETRLARIFAHPPEKVYSRNYQPRSSSMGTFANSSIIGSKSIAFVLLPNSGADDLGIDRDVVGHQRVGDDALLQPKVLRRVPGIENWWCCDGRSLEQRRPRTDLGSIRSRRVMDHPCITPAVDVRVSAGGRAERPTPSGLSPRGLSQEQREATTSPAPDV